MNAIDVFAYAADVWILSTYAYTAVTGKMRSFNLANAIGCLPLGASEIAVHAWPALLVTLPFGAIGWYGLWTARKPKPTPNTRRCGCSPCRRF